MMAKRTSRTGTPNSKNYSKGSGKISKIRSPWGKLLPAYKSKGATGKVSGSSTRKSSPAPALSGMSYPANKPYAWPVMPDQTTYDNGVPPSGLVTAVSNRVNASVEQAYTRAGYQ